jgi:hypothetical protein
MQQLKKLKEEFLEQKRRLEMLEFEMINVRSITQL